MKTIRSLSLGSLLVLLGFAFEVHGQSHLTPIPAYDPAGYDQAVYRSLLGSEAIRLWMVAKPSRHPEYAVMLWNNFSRIDESKGEKGPEELRWFIEYVEVERKIWRFKVALELLRLANKDDSSNKEQK